VLSLYAILAKCAPLTKQMKTIDQKIMPRPEDLLNANGLAIARLHLEVCQSLAGMLTTGHPKGVRRFKSHEEMNRVDEAAIVRVLAANA
jgi:hypothetical protein